MAAGASHEFNMGGVYMSPFFLMGDGHEEEEEEGEVAEQDCYARDPHRSPH